MLRMRVYMTGKETTARLRPSVHPFIGISASVLRPGWSVWHRQEKIEDYLRFLTHAFDSCFQFLRDSFNSLASAEFLK